jgi:4-hydroxybenzoate polyprenyltransferase
LIAKLGLRWLISALIVLNAGMLLAAAALGAHCFVAMVVSLLVVHEYSFGPLRAKRRPILGLLVFAQVVAFPFWIASLTEPGAQSFHVALDWIGGEHLAPSVELEVKRFLLMLAFVSLWFFAKGALKNVPDYDGDRAAGLRTSATLFPTRRHAAVASLALTIAAYSFLAVPVLLGFERTELLATLLWLIPVVWNGVRLVRAEDPGRANQCMKTDIALSSGFIALLVAMNAPTWASVPAIAAGVFVLLVSDLLQLDSRRPIDVAPGMLVRMPGPP